MIVVSQRRMAAQELVDLVRRNAPAQAEIDRLKDGLKTIADTSGGFRETFDNGAVVQVRAAGAGRFKGMLPVLDPELFLAADKAEQDRLIEAGLVRIESQYGRGSYASVTVTLPPVSLP